MQYTIISMYIKIMSLKNVTFIVILLVLTGGEYYTLGEPFLGITWGNKKEEPASGTYSKKNGIDIYALSYSKNEIATESKNFGGSWINGTIVRIDNKNLHDIKVDKILYKPGDFIHYTCAHSFPVEDTEILWTQRKDSDDIVVAGPLSKVRRLDIQMELYAFDDGSTLTCNVYNVKSYYITNNVIKKELKGSNEVSFQLNKSYVKSPGNMINITSNLGDKMENPYKFCSHQAATVHAFYAKNTHANMSLIVDSIITEEYHRMSFVCMTTKIDTRNNLITRTVEDVIILLINSIAGKQDIYSTKGMKVLIVCIVLVLFIASVVVLYVHLKRKKERQVAMEPAYAEVNYYTNPMQSQAKPGEIVYAEIQHTKNAGVTTSMQQSPYAQIIGVMEPKNK